MASWSEEQITEALAIAAAAGIREAHRRTGVPLATLHRHMQKAGITSANGNGKARRAPAQVMGEVIQARVAEQVARQVAQAIGERLEKLADRLYKLAEQAVGKIDVAISDRGEAHDRDGAAWVRALVGVMAQAVEKAQLLSGRPTQREAVEGQVTTRHEHDYTLRHIVEQRVAEDAGSPLATLLARRVGSLPRLPSDGSAGPEEATGRN